MRKTSMRDGGRKGQSSDVSRAGIIILLLLFIILATPLFLAQVQTAYELIAKESAEVVARELAGIISISASATGDIDVRHVMSSERVYNISISEREINVSQLAVSHGLEGNYRMESSSVQKILVEDLDNEYKDVSEAEIRKWVEPSPEDSDEVTSNYEFEAV